MEIRQLRYFSTLADELNFGRAAEREHIVQSGLSQQICRLERDIGVRLVDRNTHQVRLTPAGNAFLVEARQILQKLERAASIARRAAIEPDSFRIGITDSGYDFTPSLVDELLGEQPELEIRQFELGVPGQFDQLADGRLDVGVGCASLAPRGICAEPLRRERIGVFVSNQHPLASVDELPVGQLRSQPVLFADPDIAPEYNALVAELCRRAGFEATPHRGTVQSVGASIGLVGRRDCVAVFPKCVWRGSPGVRWVPLVQPRGTYTWSVLWHNENATAPVERFVAIARAHARSNGWLEERRAS